MFKTAFYLAVVPTCFSGSLYHKWTAQYDALGNEIETAFFGSDGQPVLHKNGNHKWTAQYDVRGNEIETAYFGIDGQPVLLEYGYHKWTSQFDVRGNEIESAFFGSDGQPVFLKEGYHRVISQYDEKGNLIDRQFFDVEGQQIDFWKMLREAFTPKQVTVVSILPDSQAKTLGIQAGDIFTHYDGKAIVNAALLVANRQQEPADGAAKELKILRDGKELSFMVKPGKIGVELRDSVK